jgi:hypothetical protein
MGKIIGSALMRTGAPSGPASWGMSVSDRKPAGNAPATTGRPQDQQAVSAVQAQWGQRFVWLQLGFNPHLGAIRSSLGGVGGVGGDGGGDKNGILVSTSTSLRRMSATRPPEPSERWMRSERVSEAEPSFTDNVGPTATARRPHRRPRRPTPSTQLIMAAPGPMSSRLPSFSPRSPTSCEI